MSEPLAQANGLTLSIGDDAHLRWAAGKLDDIVWPADSRCLVIDGADGIRAVFVFNYFTETSCFAHVVTNGMRNWATRGMLYGVFAFPFLHCGFRRITLPIKQNNVSAQILALKLGFSFEGRLIDAYDDGDEILMGMTRQNCIWTRDH